MARLISGALMLCVASALAACDVAQPAAVTEAPHQEGVKLDAQTLQKLGVEVKTLESTRAAPRIAGVAQVLSVEPLAQLDADLHSARASTDASRSALERAERLASEDQGVSQQALEAARRQAAVDQTQLGLLRQKVALEWGPTSPLSEDRLRERWLQGLSAGRAALLRLDFPADSGVTPEAKDVSIVPFSAPSEAIHAQLIWRAPSSTPRPTPSYFALLDAAGTLRPGDGARAFRRSAVLKPGVVVPESALILVSGAAYCYVAKADDVWTRRALSIDEPVEGGYLVTAGLKAGDRIVVRGAGLVLAAEAAGGGGSIDAP